MTTLIDNPSHFKRFDEMVKARKRKTGGDKPQVDVSLKTQPVFRVFQWSRGQDVNYVKCQSITEFEKIRPSDLTIVAAPLDHVDTIPDIQRLFETLQIPGGRFVMERLRGVTHSFGTLRAPNGQYQTSWMHFLGMAASENGANGDWVKSGVMLKWSSSLPSESQNGVADKSPIVLLCFEPTHYLFEHIKHLMQSADWGDVLQDPYILLDLVISTWYERLDDSAWKITHRARTIEKDAFNDTKTLDSRLTAASAMDLYEAHTVAKNAIYMLEGLNAALRSIDAAITHHHETFVDSSPICRATHESLQYHRELFHSTHLRILSVEKRLRNVIQLAFNLDAMRNTRVMKEDGYSMKIVAVLGMVFLPTATIAAIFGEQFFTSVMPSTGGSGETTASAFIVNPKFWLLWAIALPVTGAILLLWWFWVRSSRRYSRKARTIEDVEANGSRTSS